MLTQVFYESIITKNMNSNLGHNKSCQTASTVHLNKRVRSIYPAWQLVRACPELLQKKGNVGKERRHKRIGDHTSSWYGMQ
jgi:hypothetical protein